MSQPTNFNINFQISAEQLLSVLRYLAAGLGGSEVLSEIKQIRELTMTNAEAFKEVSDKFDALAGAVAGGLDNIKADIQKLIDAKDSLSPENAAIVASLEAGFDKLAGDVKAVADVVPDETVDPQP